MNGMQGNITSNNGSPKKTKKDKAQKEQSDNGRVHIQAMSIEDNSKNTSSTQNSMLLNNSKAIQDNKVSTKSQQPAQKKKKKVRFADEEENDLCIVHEVESYKEYNMEYIETPISCCQKCSIF